MDRPTRRTTRRALLATAGVLALGGAAAVLRAAAADAAPPDGEKACPSILVPGADPATREPDAEARAAGLPWVQHGGVVNDASCLSATPVHGVVRVASEAEIAEALRYARRRGLRVSMAGARHSMGGHAFAPGALVLDMTGFDRVEVDRAGKRITAQSGATWHRIQELLHPRLAVKAMQSTSIFTVGGSISVNAHGMDHQVGAVADTIRWLRVMLPDGTVRTLSRAQDPEHFRLVVGGYGLFGVILDAEIDVTDNVLYRSERRVFPARDFPRVFAEEIAPDPGVGLMYGHLSNAPESFFREMNLYLYHSTGVVADELPPLGEVSHVGLRRLVFNMSKRGELAKSVKWFAEKHVEPLVESCGGAEAGLTAADVCVVSRNEPMHDAVPYLRNSLPGETDILQEYFVPRAGFLDYLEAAADLLRRRGANVLNGSVRVVHRADIALSYAPEDMFALVLYLNQRTDAGGSAAMAALTRDLIDLSAAFGGTFFLPYQLHYTREQLLRAYPDADAVFAAKRVYDPDDLLDSTFYRTYARRA